MQSADFDKLITYCHELSSWFPDGIVFIGGIAVHLHAANHEATRVFDEFTHDADFYISMADLSDLRDIEELTPNRRLSKHQLIKGGFEFDIYTERHSKLVVPYSAIQAEAIDYDGIKAACVEHLLALKLDAYADRRGSNKGSKDARDVIRLAAIANSTSFRPELLDGYLIESGLDLLSEIHKSSEFIGMSQGNAQGAKRLRAMFGEMLTAMSDHDKKSVDQPKN